jgi:hypothetical protein
MTDSKPAASTSDLGVVDPIRIPGAARIRRLWAGLPWLSRVFVLLAIVDVVARALGLFGTGLFLEPTAPVTWLTAFLPHDALILLPAVILARRPRATIELPLLVRGAITISVVELLEHPVGNLASGIAVDDLLASVLVAMAAALATAAGWVAIAHGMRSFTPRTPPERVTALAGFVAGGFAIGALIAAASSFVDGNLDSEFEFAALLRLNNMVIALSGLGLAYLGWMVVRGTSDPNRPAIATNLGTISVAAAAIGAVLFPFVGEGVIWGAVVLIAANVAFTGLVVAFGLGLADPSGTIDRAVQIEPPVPA